MPAWSHSCHWCLCISHSPLRWLQLRGMLQHTAAGVRAAAAGAVGNLARHSSAFYATIAAERLLPRIIELCSDADAGVRKFACFAVGLLGECVLWRVEVCLLRSRAAWCVHAGQHCTQ